jgi:Uma2 family endonuclease
VDNDDHGADAGQTGARARRGGGDVAVVPEVVSPRPAQRDRWRWEDLEQFPEDGLRYEVVEGALVVSPSPSARHQDVAFHLAKALDAAAPHEFVARIGPFDLVFPEGDSLVPDLLVVRRDTDTDRAAVIPPVLVVEVLSHFRRHYDLVTKRERYAAFGVPRYWVVDPLEPSLLEIALDTAPQTETLHHGPGPHRIDVPFPVEVRLDG